MVTMGILGILRSSLGCAWDFACELERSQNGSTSTPPRSHPNTRKARVLGTPSACAPSEFAQDDKGEEVCFVALFCFGTSLISKMLGHSLPVTNRRLRFAS